MSAPTPKRGKKAPPAKPPMKSSPDSGSPSFTKKGPGRRHMQGKTARKS